MEKLKSKFTCDLEFYYFYSDFCPRVEKTKKWRLAFLSPLAILKGFLSLKLQNFAVK